MIDPTNCNNGEYFHDKTNSYLFVCVSGRNKQLREWIDLTGIRCNDSCGVGPEEDTREDFIRNWSDLANWGSQYPQ